MGRRQSYVRYIKSAKWRKRRELYFQTHEKKCRACGSINRIELHHKTYKNIRKERDADLAPLCYKCHNAIHKIQKKSKGSLWMITEQYIRKKNE